MAQSKERTIHVGNYGDLTDEDIRLHFESYRHGGAKVKTVTRDDVEHTVFVTLEDDKAAKRILETKSHRILDTEVDVGEAGQRKSDVETVSVTGCKGLTDDVLRLYFENPKHGGGEIKHIMREKPSKDMVHITFENPQVAKGILGRQSHRILDIDIYVSRKCQRKPDVDTVSATGCKGLTDEILQLYFESPKHGGGEIKHIMREKQNEDIAHITFESPQAAKIILETRSHRILDTEVVVSCKIQTDDITVSVAGCTDLPDEILQLYFSNPKHGGGEIQRLMRKTQDSVHITFESPQVAKRLVEKRSHKILDKEVEVTWKEKETDDTVSISGCINLKDEILQLYFENPRHGGGDIKQMKRENKNKDTVHVTFKNPEVAETVANITTHTITGTTVKVQLHRKGCVDTIFVCGFDDLTDGMLRLYFESERNGGGKVRNISRDEDGKTVHICFEEPEVVNTVLSKEHVFYGKVLTVSKNPRDPSDSATDTINLVGAENLSDYDVKCYFENPQRGGKIRNILRKENGRIISISFKDPKDADRARKKSQYTISSIPVQVKCSDDMLDAEPECPSHKTVSIKGFGPHSVEALGFYFEQEKYGGGPIESIHENKSTGLVVVTFNSAEDADRVVHRSHKLGKWDLQVKLYREDCSDEDIDEEEDVSGHLLEDETDLGKFKIFKMADIVDGIQY